MEIVQVQDSQMTVQRIEAEWQAVKASAEDMKRHALQIGSILVSIESDLSSNRRALGLGLKGWIEENLPEEIRASYATLMRWKKAAQSLMKQTTLGADQAIAVLASPATETVQNIPQHSHDKCEEILASKSITQLVFDFSDAKKAPGRKPGQNLESYANLRKTPAENAQYAWAAVIAKVSPSLADMASLLPMPYVTESLARLEPLVAALKRRLNERRPTERSRR